MNRKIVLNHAHDGGCEYFACAAVLIAAASLFGLVEKTYAAAPSATQQQIAAAATTAATDPSCLAISDGSTGNSGFYWEIDDQNGIVTDSSGTQAAGSINPPGVTSPNFTRSTSMPIASASKWLYAAYVAQMQAVPQGDAWVMPNAIVPFLNFTSGYANMVDSCSSAVLHVADATVGDCLAQSGTIPGRSNAAQVKALIGVFYYNSGHCRVAPILPLLL